MGVPVVAAMAMPSEPAWPDSPEPSSYAHTGVAGRSGCRWRRISRSEKAYRSGATWDATTMPSPGCGTGSTYLRRLGPVGPVGPAADRAVADRDALMPAARLGCVPRRATEAAPIAPTPYWRKCLRLVLVTFATFGSVPAPGCGFIGTSELLLNEGPRAANGEDKDLFALIWAKNDVSGWPREARLHLWDAERAGQADPAEPDHRRPGRTVVIRGGPAAADHEHLVQHAGVRGHNDRDPRQQAPYRQGQLVPAELSGAQVQLDSAESRDDGAEPAHPEPARPPRLPPDQQAAIRAEHPQQRAAPGRTGGPRGQVRGHRGHLILGDRGVQGVEPGVVFRQRDPAGGGGVGQRPGRVVPVGVGRPDAVRRICHKAPCAGDPDPEDPDPEELPSRASSRLDQPASCAIWPASDPASGPASRGDLLAEFGCARHAHSALAVPADLAADPLAAPVALLEVGLHLVD